MRVINQYHQTITQYDLTSGKLIPTIAIKENATPIDNVEKFAWASEDWENVQMYIPNPIKTASERITELKAMLRDTDYQILKIVEGASSLVECAQVIAQRAAWRKEINDLQTQEK